jgi:SOUL heme-binding protein
MKTQNAFTSVWVAVLGIMGLMSEAYAIEKPKYEILRSVDFGGKAIEIRDYAPCLLAETVVEAGSLKEASSEGFKRLAGFIFGGNRTRESVDMTAPVQSEKMDMTAPVGTVGGPGRYTISFVMPSKYTLETLPVPNDERVQIRQVSGRKVAAIVFSGFWSTANFDEHTALLRAYLGVEGIEALSEPMIARYNMPLTPWFLRRNEVQFEIR